MTSFMDEPFFVRIFGNKMMIKSPYRFYGEKAELKGREKELDRFKTGFTTLALVKENLTLRCRGFRVNFM